MTLEEFRNAIRDELKPIAMKYIDTIIYFEDYEKSNVHWKMMELLCSYAKGTPFNEDEDIQLHLFMHKESRIITDHLDKEIGFSFDTGFRDRSKHDIEVISENLADKLLTLTIKLFPDGNAVLVFKEGEIKPGPLKIPPVRGLTL